MNAYVKIAHTEDSVVHALHGRLGTGDVRIIVCRPYVRVTMIAAAPPVTCLWCLAGRIRFW